MNRAEWQQLQARTLRARLLDWTVALLMSSAFFAGVFCPYVWWKR